MEKLLGLGDNEGCLPPNLPAHSKKKKKVTIKPTKRGNKTAYDPCLWQYQETENTTFEWPVTEKQTKCQQSPRHPHTKFAGLESGRDTQEIPKKSRGASRTDKAKQDHSQKRSNNRSQNTTQVRTCTLETGQERSLRVSGIGQKWQPRRRTSSESKPATGRRSSAFGNRAVKGKKGTTGKK